MAEGPRPVPPPLDPIEIHVGRLVQRSVASLYSHLVTRPTGRAVRRAIEAQLADGRGRLLSLIDLSEVTVLDFSCADEVVAKLLARYLPDSRPRDAFFLFRGVHDAHREPIEFVLERQSLAAVFECSDGRRELLGALPGTERDAWERLESAVSLPDERVSSLFPDAGGRSALRSICARRLAVRLDERSEYRSLGGLSAMG